MGAQSTVPLKLASVVFPPRHVYSLKRLTHQLRCAAADRMYRDIGSTQFQPQNVGQDKGQQMTDTIEQGLEELQNRLKHDAKQARTGELISRCGNAVPVAATAQVETVWFIHQ